MAKTKIMLVEDDKSLREIYGVRLLNEGYDIVSAGDGEEALAIAIKERPELIISDVMMPKVSGYDMLDILRSTSETRNIRVIMMTALSSEEQRARAESLGADRYLVKSQVGIEDVVRVVHEVLGDTPEAAPASQVPVAAMPPQTTAINTDVPPAPAPAAMPATPTPPPVAQPAAQPVVQQPATTESATPISIPPVAAPIPDTAPIPPPVTMPTTKVTAPPSTAPKPASLKDRVLQPLNDPMVSRVNLNELLDKELAKEAGLTEESRPPIASTEQSKAIVEEQMKAFNPPSLEPVAPPNTPDQFAAQTPSPSSLPTPGIFQPDTPPVAPPVNPVPVPPVVAPTPNPVVAPLQLPSDNPPVAAIPETPVIPAMPAQEVPAVPQAPAAEPTNPMANPQPNPAPLPEVPQV